MSDSDSSKDEITPSTTTITTTSSADKTNKVNEESKIETTNSTSTSTNSSNDNNDHKKEKQILKGENRGLNLPSNEKEWYQVFYKKFVETKPSDDMLFYVKPNSESLPVNDRIFVRRWNAEFKDLPNDSATQVDWESTYYLNVVVHLEYKLEFKVCKKRKRSASSPQKPTAKYETLHCVETPIYASPNRIRMDRDEKAAETDLTFPEIFFTLHDHDMHGKDNPPLSDDSELVSIALLGSGSFLGVDIPRVELFRGVASRRVVYDTFTKLSQRNQSLNNKSMVSSVTSLITRKNSNKSSGQYLALRGPRGKGRAQMSVTEQNPDGSPAPASSNSFKSRWLGAKSTETEQNKALWCSLTYVCIPYRAIIADVTKAYIKLVDV